MVNCAAALYTELGFEGFAQRFPRVRKATQRLLEQHELFVNFWYANWAGGTDEERAKKILEYADRLEGVTSDSVTTASAVDGAADGKSV